MSRPIEAGLADAAYYAHAHLDQPLPLATLAAVAGLSPHHFRRGFREAFGEAPAAYVRRMRLERGAWRLQLHGDSILSIAIDCGFADHETFSRAFRRRYGTSPSAYRQAGRFPRPSRRERGGGAGQSEAYSLSTTRVRTLARHTIAFIRQTGPHEKVDPGLWDELDRWAERRGLPPERALLSIGHDSPGITAPGQLRFDAAITVPPGTTGDGRVRVAALSAYRCAITTHVGHYGSLSDAYPAIFRQSLSAAPALTGLPVIEIYDDDSTDIERPVSRTDVHLPIERL